MKCTNQIKPKRKGEYKMSKQRKELKTGLMVLLITLIATPAFAKSISFKDAGIVLWVFIIIGAFIILLQLIPAAILFFSFIGVGSSVAFKGKKKAEEAEEGILAPSAAEPISVKK
jgi:hypothetical protein